MWQKGPGEGFHAAKDDALAIDPKLRCRAVKHGDRLVGFVVENARGKIMGRGRLSRDAWGEAFINSGGKYPWMKGNKA